MLKKKFLSCLIVIILFSFASGLYSQDKISDEVTDLFAWLQTAGDLSIKKIKPDSLFNEAYEVYISQPLDHENPEYGNFSQRIFLSHVDISKPVVLDTEGYAVRPGRHTELSRILKCNEIVVEHRYFGESKPDTLEWQYLTIAQAAADHHRIVTLFKQYFDSKWISTGISKGGQTTIFYKYFYPDDVDASVPYVAPVNLAEEDPRIYSFLNSVGDEECRDKIINFQKTVLQKRDEILPLFRKDAEERKYTYSLGEELIFEYITLEYSFSFWQWGNVNCNDIPTDSAPAEELFQHLKKAVPFHYYSDEGVKYLAPFMYQAYTQIGYYGYDISEFKDLLKYTTTPTNKIFVPKDVEISFDCSAMQDVHNWIQDNGTNILYIYGELDTWSASSMQLTGETNAVKMIKKGGSHTTRIKHFEGEEKEKIYSTIEKWLGIEIDR